MSDVLGWANKACASIPDERFREAARQHLDPAAPRSIHWLVDALTDGDTPRIASPSPAHRKVLVEAVELRLRVEIEDLRAERHYRPAERRRVG